MPAGLPGDSQTNNLANPNAGRPVVFDPLSGPKGSPLDKDPTGKTSTGALSTGIGINPMSIIGPTAPGSIFAAGFNDNHVPGSRIVTYAPAPPPGVVTAYALDSTRMYIGGGRTIANVTAADKPSVPFLPSPYTAGVALLAAGNGGSRDAGAGPAFTGFPLKMVTAAAGIATGAAVETGFVNRSGVALVTGQSVFGSDAAASAVPS